MGAGRIIKDIKSMKVQGAKNVALAGLKALVAYSDGIGAGDRKKFIAALGKKAAAIASARPTEPALRDAISFVMSGIHAGRDTGEIKKILKNGSKNLSEKINASIGRIAEIGADRIKNGCVVFTHCHSSTVMGILKKAKSSGKKFSVIFTETRPLFQGRLTARDLSRAGIPATMIIDSAARVFMKDCNIVMLGADAVTAKGAVVNKIGSSLVALAAKEENVPVYVAADSSKMDPATLGNANEPIEERPTNEIYKNIRGIKIRNPAFDIIPPEHITGIITEAGIIKPRNVRGFMEKHFSGWR